MLTSSIKSLVEAIGRLRSDKERRACLSPPQEACQRPAQIGTARCESAQAQCPPYLSTKRALSPEDRCSHGAGIARRPFAQLHGVEKVVEMSVIGVGVLQIDGVTAIRHHHQAGV